MRTLRAMPSGDAIVAARQDPRAFTRAELISMSSASSVRTALRTGDLVRLLPDAYVAGEHRASWAARADAALAWAGRGAMLAGRSALFAHTLLESTPDNVEIVVPQGRHLHCPEWLVARQASYDITADRTGGLPVAPVAFAIAQAYGDLTASEQSQVVFGAVARRLTSAAQLRHALATMPRVRRRRALTRRIEAAERGAESWLEERSLRSVFTSQDFDCFIRQHRIDREGRRYRLDMYDPFTRTAVELDSKAWHSSEEQRLRDIRRDADLAAIGVLTVRLSSPDLTDRPEWCRQIVREVLSSRRG
jgi:very-short-patch-repair endonuclease